MRKMTAADVAAVERILQKSPEAAQWPMRGFLQDLPADIHVWVAEEGGEVIGMVAARAAGGEAELLNLAILPDQRRRGWGRRLLDGAIAEVRTAGADSIFLEVRASNSAALALYASAGFVAAGRRPGYCRNPVEDGLVLFLSLRPR
jgi:ribosomal-protein-alanine N-acetyltransferase